MNNLSVKRQEYKYFVNNADTYRLGSMLDSLMKLDEYADIVTKKYTVTSLYFETPEDDDLNEKLDGILTREKHRIRLYNHDHSVIKLETKKKNGTVISKDTAPLSVEDALALIGGNYPLEGSDNKLKNLIISKLKAKAYRPKVIVEYSRQAYCLPYGNIRITFDTDLRTYNTSTNLLELNCATSSPVFLDNSQILEVKFSADLPSYLLDVLKTIPSVRSSISKYVLCQRYTNHDPRKDCITPSF